MKILFVLILYTNISSKHSCQTFIKYCIFYKCIRLNIMKKCFISNYLENNELWHSWQNLLSFAFICWTKKVELLWRLICIRLFLFYFFFYFFFPIIPSAHPEYEMRTTPILPSNPVVLWNLWKCLRFRF